jgi:hypothetical protein
VKRLGWVTSNSSDEVRRPLSAAEELEFQSAYCDHMAPDAVFCRIAAMNAARAALQNTPFSDIRTKAADGTGSEKACPATKTITSRRLQHWLGLPLLAAAYHQYHCHPVVCISLGGMHIVRSASPEYFITPDMAVESFSSAAWNSERAAAPAMPLMVLTNGGKP